MNAARAAPARCQGKHVAEIALKLMV